MSKDFELDFGSATQKDSGMGSRTGSNLGLRRDLRMGQRLELEKDSWLDWWMVHAMVARRETQRAPRMATLWDSTKDANSDSMRGFVRETM
ncbi:MAG: hypothetical protein ACTSUE_05205 [Promethearchaeota archaeon]